MLAPLTATTIFSSYTRMWWQGILASHDASGQELLPYAHQRLAVTKCAA
jgi:hypothetical protein